MRLDKQLHTELLLRRNTFFRRPVLRHWFCCYVWLEAYPIASSGICSVLSEWCHLVIEKSETCLAMPFYRSHSPNAHSDFFCPQFWLRFLFPHYRVKSLLSLQCSNGLLCPLILQTVCLSVFLYRLSWYSMNSWPLGLKSFTSLLPSSCIAYPTIRPLTAAPLLL